MLTGVMFVNEGALETIGLVATAYTAERQLHQHWRLSAELLRVVIVSLGSSHT